MFCGDQRCGRILSEQGDFCRPFSERRIGGGACQLGVLLDCQWQLIALPGKFSRHDPKQRIVFDRGGGFWCARILEQIFGGQFTT